MAGDASVCNRGQGRWNSVVNRQRQRGPAASKKCSAGSWLIADEGTIVKRQHVFSFWDGDGAQFHVVTSMKETDN